MGDAAERVSELRERVEEQERELGAAVQDLKAAARRAVGPVTWLQESPLPFVAGALVLGWWLGSRGRVRERRRR
jgi:hypothetical protein